MKARTSSKTLRLAKRDTLLRAGFTRRHGVSAALEGGDSYGGNRREEPSLRDRDPCRVPGSSRYAPALSELVHAEPRASGASSSSGASRERRSRDRPPREPQKAWLLTSALITLGTEASARIGEIPNGSALSNADKRSQTSRGGGWRARTGVARASFRNGITSGCSGFGPQDVPRSGCVSRRRGRKWVTGKG